MNSFELAILSDDLIFSSRISTTAGSLGYRAFQFRNVAALRESTQFDKFAAVFLDLQVAGTELEGLISQIRARTSACRVIAYGSHVDAKSLSAARGLGCDIVLPRSAFAEQLELSMNDWVRPSS